MIADTATVRGTIEIPRTSAIETMLPAIRAGVSIANPAWTAARRRGRIPYGIRPEIVDLIEERDRILLPRARTDLARRYVRLHDARTEHPISVTYRGDLRPEQVEMVDRLHAAEQGRAIAPCGAGKGEVVCALVARVQQRALVIAPTIEIATDLADRVGKRLDGASVTLAVGGRWELADVVVCTPQTLTGNLDAARDAFGALIVDECHHAAADTWRACIDAIAARYRWGLTATPRADGLEQLVAHRLGSVVYRATASDMIALGRVMAPTIRQVPTAYRYDYGGPDDYAALLDDLATDGARNSMIEDLVTRECNSGEVGLVLSGRIAHCEDIAARLTARGLRARMLVGSVGKRERAEIVDAARAGNLDVICATSVADEGLDIPRLSRAFLVFPAKHEGRIVQRIGRILRPHADKSPPVVFDVCDPLVGVLNAQSKRRARVYAATWGAAAIGRAA